MGVKSSNPRSHVHLKLTYIRQFLDFLSYLLFIHFNSLSLSHSFCVCFLKFTFRALFLCTCLDHTSIYVPSLSRKIKGLGLGLGCLAFWLSFYRGRKLFFFFFLCLPRQFQGEVVGGAW